MDEFKSADLNRKPADNQTLLSSAGFPTRLLPIALPIPFPLLYTLRTFTLQLSFITDFLFLIGKPFMSINSNYLLCCFFFKFFNIFFIGIPHFKLIQFSRLLDFLGNFLMLFLWLNSAGSIFLWLIFFSSHSYKSSVVIFLKSRSVYGVLLHTDGGGSLRIMSDLINKVRPDRQRFILSAQVFCST